MLTLRCFGGVAAVETGGAEVSLRSRKHTGLLLYLVAHPRTVHVREELSYMLWDSNDRRARHSLSQALYDIRSNLGSLAVVDTNTVRLNAGRITYELTEFEQALKNKDHEAALDLYRGEFAPDLLNLGVEGFDRWLDSERERCRVLAALALRNAQRAAEERGDWDQMCLAALRLIKQNEFDEEAHCALMRGLWMKGDPASALAHYRALPDADWVNAARDLSLLADRIGERAALAQGGEAERTSGAIGREGHFRSLSRAFREAGPVVRRIAVAGDKGMGKRHLVRGFARFVATNGGHVQWLFSWPAPVFPNGARRLQGEGAQTRLIVLDSIENAWDTLETIAHNGVDSATLVVIITANLEAARGAEANGMVDAVIHLDPLSRATCAAHVLAAWPECSPAQADSSSVLSGGNPTLAEAIAEVWTQRNYEPHGEVRDRRGCDLAIESSAAVRSLIESQLKPLTANERTVAAMLADLTPIARPFLGEIVAGTQLEDAYSSLRVRGWIHDSGETIELQRPLAGYALRSDWSAHKRAGIHLRAAQVLEKGNLRARSAAAAEYEAAGEQFLAFELALKVASEGLVQGTSLVASSTAVVAARNARVLGDRFRAGVLLADCEAQRGRFRKASTVLHQLEATARTPDEQAQVFLRQGRIALSTGDRDSTELHINRLSEAQKYTSNMDLERAIEVQLAALLLLRVQHTPQTNPHLQRVSKALSAAEPIGDPYSATWCEAFRLLFSQVASKQSRSAGEDLLEEHRQTLLKLGYEGHRILKAALFLLAMRGGRLRSAVEMLGHKTQVRLGSQESRAESIDLNNIGAALMELGEFDTAGDHLKRCRELDNALDSPIVDQSFALINQAQCAFFRGDVKACETYARRLVDDGFGSTAPHFSAQAWALLGLTALGLNDVVNAARCAERIEGMPDWDGEDDFYLVSWFRAAMGQSQSRRVAVDELMAMAHKADAIDQLSAAKLRVLAGTFAGGPSGTGQGAAIEFLRASGASWFVRFARGRRLTPAC